MAIFFSENQYFDKNEKFFFARIQLSFLPILRFINAKDLDLLINHSHLFTTFPYEDFLKIFLQYFKTTSKESYK